MNTENLPVLDKHPDALNAPADEVCLPSEKDEHDTVGAEPDALDTPEDGVCVPSENTEHDAVGAEPEFVRPVIHDADLEKKVKPAILKKYMRSSTAMVKAQLPVFQRALKLSSPETIINLGIHSATLYSKKDNNKHIGSNSAILMRLHAYFSSQIYRVKPPTFDALVSLIESIDPEFHWLHLGVALGLERNSSRRLKYDGLDSSALATKLLAKQIYDSVKEDPSNWFTIKRIIEIEAESRGIYPASRVWEEGGWNRNLDAPKKKRKSLKQPKANR